MHTHARTRTHAHARTRTHTRIQFIVFGVSGQWTSRVANIHDLCLFDICAYYFIRDVQIFQKRRPKRHFPYTQEIFTRTKKNSHMWNMSKRRAQIRITSWYVCPTYKRVVSHILWTSHVTHLNESCHTCEGLVSNMVENRVEMIIAPIYLNGWSCTP